MSETDTPKEIAIKLQSSLNNVIAETINLLDFQELENVVKELQKAQRIFLFGVGSSGLTAEDAKHKLMRIGLQTDAVTNNHFMYMQASLLREGDVVIGISHSGYSDEVISSLRIARKIMRKPWRLLTIFDHLLPMLPIMY
ncbi:putative HTH-type transcriptional regulator [Actinobacillus equuli]|nr:putative HTH-type transcriptional regulator [Actinobacillus equuli]